MEGFIIRNISNDYLVKNDNLVRREVSFVI